MLFYDYNYVSNQLHFINNINQELKNINLWLIECYCLCDASHFLKEAGYNQYVIDINI